ncbi:MAG: tetratricopeptide repeat protein [Muribaculaceae bacterium]|nr:tetratricopeptide repeat protein [Muribaculaceae bacterium]
MRTIIYKTACLLMVLAAAMTTFRLSASDTLHRADSAYNRGEYDKAVELYKSAEVSEGTSAAMLYNLGNAYYKSGDEGHAMVSYMRAKRLDPRNSRINDNIKFLSSRVEDVNKAELKGKKGNVSPDPLSFFQRAGNTITRDTSSDYWAVFGALSFVILLGALAVYIFSPAVTLKKLGFFSAIIMFVFTVIFTIFALTAAHAFEKHDEVVLTAFKTTLKEEPDENAQAVGSPLHRGTLFTILEDERDHSGEPAWFKVKLNSDNIGWISASDVEII